MKILLLLLAALLVLGCDSSPPDEAEADIRGTFETFTQALGSKDGAKALEVIDEKTLILFERVRINALEATLETLNELSGYELVLTLLIRFELFPDAIEKMSATDLFTRTVDEGWLGAETSLGDLGLGGIKMLETGVGSGIATRNDDDTDFRWTFRKSDDGTWKLDLVPLAVSISREIEGRLIAQRGSRAEMALRVLEESLDQPIGREILYQE